MVYQGDNEAVRSNGYYCIEDLEPVKLGSAIINELSAQWLVDLFEYIARNLVNGFITPHA